MRVILEGPDNAGKTSLANSVIHTLGSTVAYYHPGGAPAGIDAEGECVEQQIEVLQDCRTILMDRCTPISQRVYNPDIHRDPWRAHMWSRYEALNVVVIYCRPSTDKLLRVQDFTWRGDETEEHKQKIIRNQHLFVQRYDELMQTIPNIYYDFEDAVHAKIIQDKLVQAMRSQDEAVEWFHHLINMRG